MNDPIIITFDCEETQKMYEQIQELNFFGKTDGSMHFTYEMVYPLWEVMMRKFLEQVTEIVENE
jgi:hypothetical protein